MPGVILPSQVERDQTTESQETAAHPQRLRVAFDHGDEVKRQWDIMKQDIPEEESHFRKKCRLIEKSFQEDSERLAFLDDDLRLGKSCVTSQHCMLDDAAQAQRSLRDAELRFQGIQTLMTQEYARMLQIMYSNAITTHWWEAGNIFTLDFSQIKRAAHLEVPDDAARFVNYLYPMMNSYLKRQSAEYEEPSTDFMDKVDLLRDMLWRSKDPNMEYHYFNFIVYVLFHAMPLRHFDTWSPGMMSKFEGVRSHLSSCLNDDAIIRTRSVKKYPLRFLGAASAFQELIQGYDSHKCDVEDHRMWHDRPNCFHKRHISILNDLLGRARWEVRENAFLAVSGRLPVELADIVAEYACTAEGLPGRRTVLKDIGDWDLFSSRVK